MFAGSPPQHRNLRLTTCRAEVTTSVASPTRDQPGITTDRKTIQRHAEGNCFRADQILAFNGTHLNEHESCRCLLLFEGDPGETPRLQCSFGAQRSFILQLAHLRLASTTQVERIGELFREMSDIFAVEIDSISTDYSFAPSFQNRSVIPESFHHSNFFFAHSRIATKFQTRSSQSEFFHHHSHVR